MTCEFSVDILFVDLDGTLVATDVLWESLVLAVKSDPRVVLKLPFWATQERGALKRALAQRVMPDPRFLPYREDVIEFLQKEKAQGRKLVLATASDELWAKEVAQHVGLFDDIIASNGRENLKGSNKLATIEAYCRAHGFRAFAYIGNAKADMPIWRQAAQVYVVEPPARLLTALQKVQIPSRVLGTRHSRVGPAIRAIRPQQWVKNLLVFVPLVLAHEHALAKVLAAVFAFVSFSICASSVYLINDLLDIEADRRHAIKRHRPFASGALPVGYGPIMGLGLLAFGVSFAMTTLPGAFVGVLALYLVLTILYSFWLKQTLVLDVLILAILYMLRILAGGLAINIIITEWLMAFSIFLFMSLAFVKRYAELVQLSKEGRAYPAGRGYAVTDISLIESVGPIGGYLAVLVLALYIHSDEVKQQYTNVWALWLLCPLLLYWINRVWFMAKRQELSEDPVVFATTDCASLIVGAIVAVLFILAM